MDVRKQIRVIIEPKNASRYSQVYDGVMLVAIIIGIVPLVFREQPKIFWYFDLISGACFIIDYILRWITAGYLDELKLRRNKSCTDSSNM